MFLLMISLNPYIKNDIFWIVNMYFNYLVNINGNFVDSSSYKYIILYSNSCKTNERIIR